MKAYAPKNTQQSTAGSKPTSGGGDPAVRAHTAAGLVLAPQVRDLLADAVTQAVRLVDAHTEQAKNVGLQGATYDLHEEASHLGHALAAQVEAFVEAVEKAALNQETVLRDLFAQADATAAHLNGYPTTVGALREG
jgi:hypothetical protein